MIVMAAAAAAATSKGSHTHTAEERQDFHQTTSLIALLTACLCTWNTLLENVFLFQKLKISIQI